jgi:hypothetical protein
VCSSRTSRPLPFPMSARVVSSATQAVQRAGKLGEKLDVRIDKPLLPRSGPLGVCACIRKPRTFSPVAPCVASHVGTVHPLPCPGRRPPYDAILTEVACSPPFRFGRRQALSPRGEHHGKVSCTERLSLRRAVISHMAFPAGETLRQAMYCVLPNNPTVHDWRVWLTSTAHWLCGGVGELLRLPGSIFC